MQVLKRLGYRALELNYTDTTSNWVCFLTSKHRTDPELPWNVNKRYVGAVFIASNVIIQRNLSLAQKRPFIYVFAALFTWNRSKKNSLFAKWSNLRHFPDRRIYRSAPITLNRNVMAQPLSENSRLSRLYICLVPPQAPFDCSSFRPVLSDHVSFNDQSIRMFISMDVLSWRFICSSVTQRILFQASGLIVNIWRWCSFCIAAEALSSFFSIKAWVVSTNTSNKARPAIRFLSQTCHSESSKLWQ